MSVVRSELPRPAPAEVTVKTLVAIRHHSPDAPPRDFAAGALVAVERGVALRWHALGLADLQDYAPEAEELRGAVRHALEKLDAERLATGLAETAWCRVPFNARRLARLASILAALEPQEVA